MCNWRVNNGYVDLEERKIESLERLEKVVYDLMKDTPEGVELTLMGLMKSKRLLSRARVQIEDLLTLLSTDASTDTAGQAYCISCFEH
jgi:hypothetical protein